MKTVKPLTVKQIDNAKPTDTPYRLYDGGGLSLLVKSTAKIWHFNYQKPITKKRTMVSFGAYPIVSLMEARQKRDEYKSLLAQNIDPQAHIKAQNAKKKSALDCTFHKVSQDWLAEQDYQAKTLDGANRYLRYAYDFIENKPISELTAFDVLDICQAVYDKHGSLMATGVKTKIAQVLDFALARRLVMQNVARNLVNTHKKHKKGNNPAITDPAQFAQFLYAINQASDCGFVVKSYLQIAPYVFVRPQELAQMHVSDIDFEQKQWRYTPTKTENSTQTALIVPLSDQVITKIYDLLAFHNQGYVFYSNRGKRPHIERARANEWLRKNGYQGVQSLHGLRATARTMLEEILDYPPHIIEMQLGHQVKDMNGTAYNRTKFIQKRTQMMNEWACYLDKLLGDYFKIMVG